MTREEFREAVFARDGRRCVNCGNNNPDMAAHHLIERRLWPDGGYHVDNGVTLCGPCHILAEQTIISVHELRQLAGITKVLLPPTLEDDHNYDKWGNIILSPTSRMRGPLFYDESVQKILAPVLLFFVPYTKYPRTPHLPWSDGVKTRNQDDMLLETVPFHADELVVITEKMDGENTTMYRDHIHARSLEGGYHASRTWVKNLWSQKVAWQIPEGMRICGENLFAVHSLKYNSLSSYFQVFGIWEDDRCLSWGETEETCSILGLDPVPVLFMGSWESAEEYLRELSASNGAYFDFHEGYVVRSVAEFRMQDFQKKVAKYVRPDHITTSTHWAHGTVELNGLSL